MREIEFRGKRVDNSEWVYGHLLYDEENEKAFIASYFESESAYIFKVDPSTVGQYTGLKDSYENKVFEGDILHWYSPNGDTNGSDLSCKVIVYWDEVGFEVKGYEDGLISFLICQYNETVKVIGNIHDNPELLEVK